MPKRLLRNPDEMTTYDVAAYLGIPRHTLLAWCRRGKIAEPERIGNKRVWTREQADQLKGMVSRIRDARD
jgi:excisionase family DNA binding protein